MNYGDYTLTMQCAQCVFDVFLTVGCYNETDQQTFVFDTQRGQDYDWRTAALPIVPFALVADQ